MKLLQNCSSKMLEHYGPGKVVSAAAATPLCDTTNRAVMNAAVSFGCFARYAAIEPSDMTSLQTPFMTKYLSNSFKYNTSECECGKS